MPAMQRALPDVESPASAPPGASRP
jgi:hypothetical protein